MSTAPTCANVALFSGGDPLAAALPSGYAYVVDSSGNYVVDASGNYVIARTS